MKKNILITGASGFIGSFLVEKAVEKGYETFAGIRSSSSRKYLNREGVHFLELDFNSDRALDATLSEYAGRHGGFEYIIHTAGLTKTNHLPDFDRVNFEGTRRFVEAIRRNQLVPEKFVFISSLASYGPGIGHSPVLSGSEQKPVTAYGKSKLLAEQFLYTQTDFPFVIVNPTAVYGPRDKDFYFLLKSIEQHLELYIGDKNQLLSFVHVDDLVDAIFLAAESPAFRQNLLVGDLETYTSRQVNELIKEQLKAKTVSLVVPASIATVFALFSETIGKMRGEVPILNRERLKEFKARNWSIDCSGIASLGYQPRYKLENGLSQTINWYREQGLLKS